MGMEGRNPAAAELIGRFAYRPSDTENAGLANDLKEGWGRVSEEAKEQVAWKRAPFNWPGAAQPQAGYFAICDMAHSVLMSLGYGAEARQLSAAFKYLKPAYGDLPDLLWKLLDFGPAPGQDKIEELRKKAQELGMDPEALDIRKVPEKNLFPVRLLEDEKAAWDLLAQMSGRENEYGKNAAFCVGPKTAGKWIARWLGQMSGEAAQAQPGEPGDLEWFREHYPLGFSSLDVFGDTPAMLCPGFEGKLCMMFWECLDKTSRGWSAKDAARIGWDHKSLLGLTGTAVAAQEAWEYFLAQVEPALARAGGPALAAAAKDPLCAYVEKANPGLSAAELPLARWRIFAMLAPEAARTIRDLWLESKKGEAKAGGAKLAARLEALEIEASSISLAAGGMPAEPAPLPAAKTLRI